MFDPFFEKPSAERTVFGKTLDVGISVFNWSLLAICLIGGLSDPNTFDYAKGGVLLSVFFCVLACRPKFVCKAKYNRITGKLIRVRGRGTLGINFPTLIACTGLAAAVHFPVLAVCIAIAAKFTVPTTMYYMTRKSVVDSGDNRYFGIGSLFGKNDQVSALLHDMLIMMSGVMTSSDNMGSVVAHLAAFLTAQVRTGLIPTELPVDVDDTLSKIWQRVGLSKEPKETRAQLDSGFMGLLSNKQSKSIITVVVVAVASLITLMNGDFNAERVMNIYEGYIKIYDSNPVRFGTNLVEAIRITFVSITNYVKTGQFDWFSHSSKDFEELQTRYAELDGKFKNYGQYSNDPNSSAMVAEAAKLDKDVDAVMALSKTLKTYQGRFTAAVAAGFAADVKSLRFKIETRHHLFGLRRVPFAALIVGSPGIGKTTITNHLVSLFCSVYGKEYKEELIYKPNQFTSFDDGLQGNMHTIIMDDVAYQRPSKANGIDPSIADLMGLVGNFPQMANMAALEDKATRTKNFDCVIANTNTLDLNAKHYFSYPNAALRRLPIIVMPKVKPGFNKGDMLDSSKVREADFEMFDDAWTYTVKRVTLVNQKVVYQDIICDANIEDYFRTMVQLMKTHKDIQDGVVGQSSKLAEAKYCEQCYMPVVMCNCEPIEPSEEGKVDSLGKLLSKVDSDDDEFRLPRPFTAKEFFVGSFVWTLIFGAFTFMYRFRNHPWRFFVRCIRRYALGRIYAQLDRDRLMNIAWSVSKYLTIGAAAYMAYKAFFVRKGISFDEFHADGLDEEIPEACRPEYPMDHRQNVWAHLFTHKPIETTHRSRCAGGGDPNQHYESILNSTFGCWFLLADNPKVGRKANVIYLKDGVFVTTSHCAYHGEKPVRMIAVGSGRSIVHTHNCLLEPGSFVRDGELIYFRAEGLTAKPLFNLLPLNRVDESRVLGGVTLTRRLHSEAVSSDTFLFEHISAKVMRVGNPSDIFKGDVAPDQKEFIMMKSKDVDVHAQGDCGSPVVSTAAKALILSALHVGHLAGENVSWAVPIDATSAQKAIDYLKKAFTDSCDVAWIKAEEDGFSLREGEKVGTLHERSPFGFLKEQTSITVHGSLTKNDGTRAFRNSHKSRVIDAITREYVTERGYGTDHTAPNTKARWTAVTYLLKASVVPFSCIPMGATWKIADHMMNTFYGKLDSKAFGVLTDIEVINGVPESNFIQGMDMAKGTGYPFLTKKHCLVREREDPNGPKEWKEEVMAIIRSDEEKLLARKRVGFCFNCFYKDEPVRLKKFLEMKTRVICGCPLSLQHLVRKYFLTIVAEMTRTAKWEGAVGINATGPEWGILANRLKRFGGEHIIAGDFEGFDWKTVNNAVLRPSLGIFLAMARRSGRYTADHMTIMEGLASEICHAHLDFFGDLISVYANPSGQPLTTPVNCLVVSIVMRLAWIAHRTDVDIESIDHGSAAFIQALNNFEEFNELVTYGDDHVLSTADKTFTFRKVKSLLIGAGMGYTAADKTSREHDFETLEQVTFLRRKFVFDDGKWLAPLDLESIKKSLNAVMPGTLEPHEHAVAVLTSHHRELAFHTKDIFIEWTALFDDIVNELQLGNHLISSAPRAANSYFPTRDYYLGVCFSEDVVRRSLKEDDLVPQAEE